MKEKLLKIWKSFSLYEKIWFFSVVVLTIVIAVLFPSVEEDLDLNSSLIMFLYVGDVFTNVLCELLISKQSKWNFIVSLFVEFFEIAICIAIAERFATLATTIFFWIPVDIISFVNWHRHRDQEQEELTIVRTLKGYQEVLVILGIFAWTIGIGYLLTKIDVEGILEADTTAKLIVCYADAAASAVSICNGLFILFRFREQWIAWYICAILEIIMNIILHQWVLIVLKVAYLTNTTYGYIKWTKYIHQKETTKGEQIKCE